MRRHNTNDTSTRVCLNIKPFFQLGHPLTNCERPANFKYLLRTVRTRSTTDALKWSSCQAPDHSTELAALYIVSDMDVNLWYVVTTSEHLSRTSFPTFLYSYISTKCSCFRSAHKLHIISVIVFTKTLRSRRSVRLLTISVSISGRVLTYFDRVETVGMERDYS